MDALLTPQMTVRKMPFEFSKKISPQWNPKKPEWSHMVNGASLAMPFLEPYLIRTLGKALQVIDTPKLTAEIKLYMAQEGQHFQQHKKFNDTLVEQGYRELRDIEAEMKHEFSQFEAKRSLKFNLAYACGFESMALGIGHWLVKDREYLFGGSDSRVASLVLWHFVEEIEHKNVAFDAYQAVYGGWFYRLYGTFYATAHVIKFSRRAYKVMLKKDGLWASVKSRWALLKMSARFFVNMIVPLLSVCLPGHHPSQVKDPEWYQQWLESYGQNEASVVLLDTNNLGKMFSD